VVFYGFETIKQKIMSTEKDLNYWKENAEEDYKQVPISVLRYITELETAVKNCSIPDVSECVTWTTDEVLNIIEENEHLDDLRMFFTEHGR